MQYDDSLSESYRRFLAGDESAAREVMDGLFLGLVRFIAGYVRDMPSAEDIAMDVMAELFAKRRGYEPRSKLKTYAYMRGKCLALDLLRHRKALPFEGLDACGDLPDGRAELDAELLKTERERELSKALDLLPADLRAAVRLVYFEGMSYEEAARVLKKTRKQTDNLLYRAKLKLREILGEEGRDLL
ncbi:MAG: RNA polymerase sigma factor [Clostridia bacterium]|nr:RNA polymerase sigma factor [Clostridia bacterium]